MDLSTFTSSLSFSTMHLSHDDVVRNGSSVNHSGKAQVGQFLYFTGHTSLWSKGHGLVMAVLDTSKHRWRWIEHGNGSFARTVLYEDTLYCFDLYTNGRAGIRDGLLRVCAFDLITEEFSDLRTRGTPPDGRLLGTVEYSERHKRCVVFGGMARRGLLCNDVHLFTLPGCQWIQPKVTGQPPAARMRHSSCTYKGVIYYYGGESRTPVTLIHGPIYMLTLESGVRVRWSCGLTTHNRPIQGKFGLIALKGKLLMLGCTHRNHDEHLLTVYDLESQNFQTPENILGSWRIPDSPSSFHLYDGNSIGLIGNDYSNYTRVSVGV